MGLEAGALLNACQKVLQRDGTRSTHGQDDVGLLLKLLNTHTHTQEGEEGVRAHARNKDSRLLQKLLHT